jgi:hypothetical protein
MQIFLGTEASECVFSSRYRALLKRHFYSLLIRTKLRISSLFHTSLLMKDMKEDSYYFSIPQ